MPTVVGTGTLPPEPEEPTVPIAGEVDETAEPSTVHRTVVPDVADVAVMVAVWPAGRSPPAGVMTGAYARAISQ